MKVRIVFASLLLVLLVSFIVLPKLKTVDNQSKEVKAAQIEVKLEASPPATIERTPDYQDPPKTTASAAIIIDAKTTQPLYEKDSNAEHLPASTTKLMTALVALEKCNPDTVLTMGIVQKDGTKMGLETGDQITVENLLYGLLINSGNDAAYALASGCSNSFNQFVDRMNEKAKELGMTNSHFMNPAGFDSPNHFSTAHDLAYLAKVAVTNPLISKIVTTKSTVVTDISGKKTYYLENVNKLLGVVDGVEGVKTGQTEGSLEILISKTTRHNNSIIVAVLGSHDRFGESKDLIEWAFKNYHWKD